MFDDLTDTFQGIFQKITGKSRLTEKNISSAVHDVRSALLEADVHYDVVKGLMERIKKKALGKKVLRSVSPGQQFIKVVHEELTHFMGGQEAKLSLSKTPATLLVCGLQGAGKTTFVAKLGRYLQRETAYTSPLLVACDLQRPAAVEQLKTLGSQASVSVFSLDGEKNPRVVATKALAYAKENNHDVVVFDTAGRLHVDDALMEELHDLKQLVQPEEILFVANATLGQDAVNTAKAFHDRMTITGTVLTMLDGNTRGGAALSIAHITKRPLKFEGIGEKLDDLQLFHPKSMADRVLGMGDTVNLVRKAQEVFDEKEQAQMEEKLKKASFTYGDLLKQMQMIKRMGSFKGLLKMMPRMGGMNLAEMVDEKQFTKMESIIQSMTQKERDGIVDINMSRRKRIARGSGNTLDEVNRWIKTYNQAKDFFKKKPDMKKLQKMMGGAETWR